MVTDRIGLGTLLTPVSRVRPVGPGVEGRHGRPAERWSGHPRRRARRAARRLAGVRGGRGRARPGRRSSTSRSPCTPDSSVAGTDERFRFEGKHYSARPTDFGLPPPTVQRPHPPVWMVGAHVLGRERQPSLDRAARWQGLIPQIIRPAGRDKGRSIDGFADSSDWSPRDVAPQGCPCAGYDVDPRGRQQRRVRQARSGRSRGLGRCGRDLVGRELVVPRAHTGRQPRAQAPRRGRSTRELIGPWLRATRRTRRARG